MTDVYAVITVHWLSAFTSVWRDHYFKVNTPHRVHWLVIVCVSTYLCIYTDMGVCLCMYTYTTLCWSLYRSLCVFAIDKWYTDHHVWTDYVLISICAPIITLHRSTPVHNSVLLKYTPRTYEAESWQLYVINIALCYFVSDSTTIDQSFWKYWLIYWSSLEPSSSWQWLVTVKKPINVNRYSTAST